MATLWIEYGYSMGRVWLHLAKSLPTPWELLAITLPKGNRKLSTLSSRKPENCQPKAAEKTYKAVILVILVKVKISYHTSYIFHHTSYIWRGVTNRDTLGRNAFSLTVTCRFSDGDKPFSASKQAVLRQNTLQLTNKCWNFGTHSCAFGRGEASKSGVFCCFFEAL